MPEFEGTASPWALCALCRRGERPFLPALAAGLWKPYYFCMISQRARYAFKAMVALARAEPGRGLNIRQLCEQEKLPRKFIEQILSSLRQAGYISSRRGRDGGYELLKPADLIHIGPLLRLVDGPIAPLPCLSRTAYRKCDDCRDEVACELRRAFDKPYADYLARLEAMTLAQLLTDKNAF